MSSAPRFAPELGGNLLRRRLGWPRTTGEWERRLARRHRNRAGIVFGFRGPPAGQRGKHVSPEWIAFELEIGGIVVHRDPADSLFSPTMLRPKIGPQWLPWVPGSAAVTIRSLIAEPSVLAELSVEVPAREPVIVGVMPEIRQFGAVVEAVVWSYRLEERSRHHVADVRRALADR